MIIEQTVTAHLVGDDERQDSLIRHFGRMMLRLERAVFTFADLLSADYGGGNWEYYELSNGGFYMAPRRAQAYTLMCENGFAGEVSADAMGIIACLYARSHLSFTPSAPDSIGQHFHYLRDFAASHIEAALIFQAID